jgi:23S rRNA (guanosine2251-2'-O)-methyltransferase
LYVVRGVPTGERLAADARAAGIVVEVVTRDVLDEMTGGAHHQGVAVRTSPVPLLSVDEVLQSAPQLVVVLDGLTDPQNVGAIIRSAEVLGAGALILPKDRSATVSPAVVRASSGAALHLPVAQVVNVARGLEQLKSAGYWTIGLDAEATSRFRDLPAIERAALVIGGEGKGIRPLVAKACDFMLAIPVRGRVTSLNAAAAAAIGLHELAARLPATTAGPR